MTSFQTTIEDTTYNGWSNYQTWNVALWIGNTEGLYHIAKDCKTYSDFVNCMGDCDTGDGVSYNDPNLNCVELDEMIEELN